MGPELMAFQYKGGVKDAVSTQIEDYQWPVEWDTDNLVDSNPGHHPIGTGRVGGAHYFEVTPGNVVTNHTTSHAFENASDPGDWVWYGFRHQLTQVTNPTDEDSVLCMVFRDSNLVSGTMLCVTLVITAPGDPDVFATYEYEIRKLVITTGPLTMTISNLSDGAITTSATYAKDIWHYIDVGVQRHGVSGTKDKFQLWVDNVSIGTSSGTGLANLYLNGGYMLPDTRTAAGKGSTICGHVFSDLTSNDDQGNGLIVRPGSVIGAAPYFRV